MKRPHLRSTRFSLAIAVIIVCAGAFAWHERLAFWDYSRLHNYHPSKTIQQLADQTTMTPYARHLFYVYHPGLQNSSAFNKNCNVTNQAIVLGCTSIGKGIYLYKVTDPELNGIEQVTAAYEMLHVGYSRLSTHERERIDRLVQQAFQAAEKSDPRLKAEEQSYLKTEGTGAVPNELHSMMGTEVANLPPVLETYYKQYFTNRQTIISLKNQYQSVFTNRQQIVTADDTQLEAWKQIITNDEDELNNQNTQLSAKKNRMNQQLAGGQTDAYNAQVSAYNSSVQAYNSLLAETKQLIAGYNQLVATRNAAALAVNQLYQTISSQPLNRSPSAVKAQ